MVDRSNSINELPLSVLILVGRCIYSPLPQKITLYTVSDAVTVMRLCFNRDFDQSFEQIAVSQCNPTLWTPPPRPCLAMLEAERVAQPFITKRKPQSQ